jgi:hypothetical protein
MNITLTKEKALKIQAEQVAHYMLNPNCPLDFAERVAEATNADALEDGVEYPVQEINRHIPRGGKLEYMAGLLDQGGN